MLHLLCSMPTDGLASSNAVLCEIHEMHSSATVVAMARQLDPGSAWAVMLSPPQPILRPDFQPCRWDSAGHPAALGARRTLAVGRASGSDTMQRWMRSQMSCGHWRGTSGGGTRPRVTGMMPVTISSSTTPKLRRAEHRVGWHARLPRRIVEGDSFETQHIHQRGCHVPS